MDPPCEILVIGPISLDRNIDHTGFERREVGGAVVASAFAMANSGHDTAVFTKYNPTEVDGVAVFEGLGARVFWAPSSQSTSIENRYLSADKERRLCRSLGSCDPFLYEELPSLPSRVLHFAGLTYGDFSGEIFAAAASRGKVAVDVQCLLRHIEADGSMDYHDWAEKERYLPVIDFLKTDAAEAEILTGATDRRQAARILAGWGSMEIMITHHTEALVFDGQTFYTCPLISRNLSGRTGRGDTCFAAYLGERLHAGIPEALTYACGVVSLKMETPGPYRGSRQDALDYIEAAKVERGFQGTRVESLAQG